MESQESRKASELVSLAKLSELAGFSEKFILDELFKGEDLENAENIEMDKLREVMIRYLNSTELSND